MALSVIGAGFGRTGTLSLKGALEKLGFGPCHHMQEVMQNPGQSTRWLALANGASEELATIMSPYRATVDWPGATYWRELIALYPEAKVLLSLRDGAGWHRSVMNTIYKALTAELPEDVPEHIKFQFKMNKQVILNKTFDNQLDDAAHATAVFDAHNQAVIDAVPKENLLVYRPGDGWQPLCEFLEVDVPEEDYPHVNSSADFPNVFMRPLRGDS